MLIRSITLISLLLLVSGCNTAISGDRQVAPSALAKEIAGSTSSDKKLVIVDVREPELFNKGHIPGAINLPYPGVKKSALAQLKPDQEIVFICHGGPMGDELVNILSAKGYGNVRNLAGGMDDWKGPVEGK